MTTAHRKAFGIRVLFLSIKMQHLKQLFVEAMDNWLSVWNPANFSIKAILIRDLIRRINVGIQNKLYPCKVRQRIKTSHTASKLIYFFKYIKIMLAQAQKKN